MQLRAHPRGHRKARDATKAGAQAILSYDAKAFEDAAYGDVGDLGDRKCVHCGALLFAGEAVRAGAGCWRGKTCCCKGTVQLDPIGRSEAIDELFETPRHAKTLTQHARRCFCPGAPNCACTPACCWRAPTSSSPLPHRCRWAPSSRWISRSTGSSFSGVGNASPAWSTATMTGATDTGIRG